MDQLHFIYYSTSFSDILIIFRRHRSFIFVFLLENFHEGTDVIAKEAEVKIVDVQYFLQDVRFDVAQDCLIVHCVPVSLGPAVQMVDLSQVPSPDLKYSHGDIVVWSL